MPLTHAARVKSSLPSQVQQTFPKPGCVSLKQSYVPSHLYQECCKGIQAPQSSSSLLSFPISPFWTPKLFHLLSTFSSWQDVVFQQDEIGISPPPHDCFHLMSSEDSLCYLHFRIDEKVRAVLGALTDLHWKGKWKQGQSHPRFSTLLLDSTPFSNPTSDGNL